MKKRIQKSKSALLQKIFSEQRLAGILVFRAGRDRWDQWLFEDGGLPALPSFRRGSVYFLLPDGNALCLSEVEPHPTAPEQYPILTSEHLEIDLAGKRVGTVNGNRMLVSTRNTLAACHGLELVDVTERFWALRMEKISEEQDALSAAAQCYDRAFSALPLLLQEGRLESEVAVDLRHRIAQIAGSCEDMGVNTLVRLVSAHQGEAVQPQPLGYPGRRLQSGDRIDLTVNGWVDSGWAAALGRSYVLGEALPETRQLWNLTLQAQTLAADLSRPGQTLAQIEHEVIQRVVKPNHLELMQETWIYGIGCDRSEFPRDIDATKDIPLREGMTLVIAPRLAWPGQLPVCCMDVFTVGSTGAQRFSRLDQTLQELN